VVDEGLVAARLDVEEHPHQEQADQAGGDLRHLEEERIRDVAHGSQRRPEARPAVDADVRERP
jgi:hypothetical protein